MWQAGCGKTLIVRYELNKNIEKFIEKFLNRMFLTHPLIPSLESEGKAFRSDKSLGQLGVSQVERITTLKINDNLPNNTH